MIGFEAFIHSRLGDLKVTTGVGACSGATLRDLYLVSEVGLGQGDPKV